MTRDHVAKCFVPTQHRRISSTSRRGDAMACDKSRRPTVIEALLVDPRYQSVSDLLLVLTPLFAVLQEDPD